MEPESSASEPVESLSPPETIPTYVAEGVLRQDTETLHDIREYVDELLEHREQQSPEVEDVVGEDEEIVEMRDAEDRGTVVLKLIPCGKESCGSCPHGPYAYRAYWEDGATRTEYLGRADGER